MRELLELIKGGAYLDTVRHCSREEMNRLSRMVSTGRPEAAAVASLCVKRWWCKAVFDATTDCALDDKSRVEIIKILAECVDYGQKTNKNSGAG